MIRTFFVIGLHIPRHCLPLTIDATMNRIVINATRCANTSLMGYKEGTMIPMKYVQGLEV